MFVPQYEPNASEALSQPKPSNLEKLGKTFQAGLQTIIRNLAAQMMQVMNTDISRKPVQDRGQDVKRASKQSAIPEIPSRTACVLNAIELMLYVENPDTKNRSQEGNWQLCKQEGLNAYHGVQGQKHGDYCDIGHHHAFEPDKTIRPAHWKAMFQDEKVSGTDAEKDPWISVDSVP